MNLEQWKEYVWSVPTYSDFLACDIPPCYYKQGRSFAGALDTVLRHHQLFQRWLPAVRAAGCERDAPMCFLNR